MATLQSRLADVITAIGLDIKALTAAVGGGSSSGSILGVFPGATYPTVGTVRYYPPANITFTSIEGWLSANAVTNVVATVKKNGVSAQVVTINSGTLKVTQATTISLLTTDYITIDITSGSGSDLVLRLDQ